MIQAQADVALGEAITPAAIAHGRVYRGGFVALIVPALILAGCTIGGSLAATALLVQFPGGRDWIGLGTIAAMVVGMVLALQVYARNHRRGFLAALRQMGSPDFIPTSFGFDETGIRVDTDRISHRIAWSAVLFIVPAPDHWLLQVDTITIALPRRAFADSAAEQAFLDLAAGQLTAEAKARSVLERR